MGRIEVVYPNGEESVDDGIGSQVSLERILKLLRQQSRVHHGGNCLFDNCLVQGCIVEYVLAGIEPEEHLFRALQGHLDATQDGHPRSSSRYIASDLSFKDGYKLFLKSIGNGVVVCLVLVEVGIDGSLDVVWERQCRLCNVGRDDLAQILDGAIRVGPISKLR